MSAPAQRRLSLALLPVVIFAGLALLFWRGLSGDPALVPSVLVGKPMPAFDLPPVEGLAVPGLATGDFKQRRVTVLNVWGSWCGPCRTEHPLLMELAKRTDIALVGLNYKDEPANARRFLATLGQPFARIGADPKGRTFIDLGSYGVPETFVIDGQGIIRYKWIGPLSERALKGDLDAAIRQAAEPWTGAGS